MTAPVLLALAMLATSASADGRPQLAQPHSQVSDVAGEEASPAAAITAAAIPAAATPGVPVAGAGEAAVQTGTPPRAQAAVTPAPDPAPSADVVVTGRPRGDPLRKVNEQSFAATQAVDEAITGPAALAYKRLLPDPVRSGLRNFLNNLHEPTVALNYLLQLKPGKAAETVGRFTLNTTIGLGGLLDIAKRKPFKLPRRPNGFADTLGFYGVRPGAYVFLPLIGPTTVRDLVGGAVDRLLIASAIRGPFGGRAYLLTSGAVRVLDRRAETDDRARAVRASDDPYRARRALYMHKRQAEIEQLHGRHTDPSTSSPELPASVPVPVEPAPDPVTNVPTQPAPAAPSSATPP